MAINFPDSPSNGDTASLGGKTYTYDSTSTSWAPAVGGTSATTIYSDMAALIAATGMSAGDQALVTALNKVFMYTGSAWYLVATMTNASPTAITGVDGTYTLALDGTATTITAVSSDPEGFPLTWSYAVTTGSLGSTATVSQADNVFTITPSSTEADAGTFSITFSVTDGTTGAVNTVSAFTLAFTTYVDDQIVLYIDAGDSTSYSGVAADISGNSHTATVTGASYTEVTGSDSSGTSSYFTFNGSSDNITTNLQRDNDSFTYSMWIYPTINNYGYLMSTYESTSQEWTALSTTSNGTLDWLIDNNGTKVDLLATSPLAINTWCNIVGTYNGTSSSMKLYRNATLESSTTHPVTSTILGLSPLTIGKRAGVTTQSFAGRIGIVQTYSKELIQSEITQNWDYYRGRYGL